MVRITLCLCSIKKIREIPTKEPPHPPPGGACYGVPLVMNIDVDLHSTSVTAMLYPIYNGMLYWKALYRHLTIVQFDAYDMAWLNDSCLTLRQLDIYLFICFYLRPVLAFGYCPWLCLSVYPSARLCVNPQLVCAITCHPFKLESLNWDQEFKTPWLRSILL